MNPGALDIVAIGDAIVDVIATADDSFLQTHGLTKVAPLFDWTRAAVADFCALEQVPINPLHAEGYPSIGCEPCTRAIRPGEPERAGRWWWETDEAKECGLHVAADGRLTRKAA